LEIRGRSGWRVKGFQALWREASVEIVIFPLSFSLLRMRNGASGEVVVKSIAYGLFALALVAVLHISGLLAAVDLTHPIWRNNATLYGSLIGVAISLLLFWVERLKPRLGRMLGWTIGVVFIIALAATLTSAKIFIDAAAYDPAAVQIWHKGSYTVFATFIPAAAFVARKLVGFSRK